MLDGNICAADQIVIAVGITLTGEKVLLGFFHTAPGSAGSPSGARATTSTGGVAAALRNIEPRLRPIKNYRALPLEILPSTERL